MAEPQERNLREVIVERVRSEIVAGRGAPGTLYSVPALAEQMGVSTTPVREALLELSRSGLVAPLKNRGFRVQSMSLKELDDLFAMRVLLERHALELIAERGLTDAEPLRALAEAVRGAVAREDVSAYLSTDRAFHEALVQRADNPRMTQMVLALRDDMRLYGIDTQEGRARQRASVDEHFRMIDLAVARDRRAIGELITQHIMDWRPLFAGALEGPTLAALRAT